MTVRAARGAVATAPAGIPAHGGGGWTAVEGRTRSGSAGGEALMSLLLLVPGVLDAEVRGRWTGRTLSGGRRDAGSGRESRGLRPRDASR